MYIDKVFLTIAFCVTSAWCSELTSTRNARTIDLSLFLTPETLFRNRLSIFMRKFWPSQLQKWTRNSVASLLRSVSSVYIGKAGQRPMRIEFRPEDGPRAAKIYQQRFGYRGQWLIEQLGNGLGPNVRLNRLQSVSSWPPIFLFKDKNFF